MPSLAGAEPDDHLPYSMPNRLTADLQVITSVNAEGWNAEERIRQIFYQVRLTP